MTFAVAVINTKGGCGKTMIATHLAAAFAASGLVTALADYDRQKSAVLWGRLRPETASPVAVLDWRADFGNMPKKVQRLVIDCPSSLKAAGVRDIIQESNAVVVPLLPSVYDERSTLAFLERAEDIKKVRKGEKQILIAANRYREVSRQAKRLDRLMLGHGHHIAARIPDRSIYPRLAERGLTVFDVATKAGSSEQEHWLALLEPLEGMAAGST